MTITIIEKDGKILAKEIYNGKLMKVHSEDIRTIPGCPKSIPMNLLSEEMAKHNHGQSLERLNERGGLGLEEIIAIIEQSRVTPIEPKEALIKVNEYLKLAEERLRTWEIDTSNFFLLDGAVLLPPEWVKEGESSFTLRIGSTHQAEIINFTTVRILN